MVHEMIFSIAFILCFALIIYYIFFSNLSTIFKNKKPLTPFHLSEIPKRIEEYCTNKKFNKNQTDTLRKYSLFAYLSNFGNIQEDPNQIELLVQAYDAGIVIKWFPKHAYISIIEANKYYDESTAKHGTEIIMRYQSYLGSNLELIKSYVDNFYQKTIIYHDPNHLKMYYRK